MEVVKLQPDPVFRPAEDITPSVHQTSPSETPVTNDTSGELPAQVALPAQPKPKRSLAQRINPLNLFRNEPKPAARTTPLPPPNTSAPPQEVTMAANTSGEQTSPIPSTETIARYNYVSPSKPQPGNHAEAERSFAQGLQAQQKQRLQDAIQSYRMATTVDPAYFEAWYNMGLAASSAGETATALAAYENALAVRPDSLDARYNFALVLKQASYSLDAVHELEKLLAANSNEARAHLVLANLYAQQLHQPANARPHYLKVLELDPRNPQDNAIRNWLSTNPQ